MRADRLLAILLVLQRRGRVSARELAAELEVSERTIYRDIQSLSSAGVPVYAERGRNGGCALLEGYRTDVTGLTVDEALALFTFAGHGAPTDSHTHLRQALRKVLAGLPAAQRPAVEAAQGRVVVDAQAWSQPPDDVAHLATAQDAVRLGRQLRLSYRASDDLTPRPRTVDPYGLVVKAGIWYLIAATDGQPHLYRLSRIDHARLLASAATRPADLDLQTLWRQLRSRFEERGEGVAITVKVRTNQINRLVRLSARQLAQPAPTTLPPADPDGWITLDLRYVASGAARAVLAGFGGDVEVLHPATLRQDMIHLAHDILARHR